MRVLLLFLLLFFAVCREPKTKSCACALCTMHYKTPPAIALAHSMIYVRDDLLLRLPLFLLADFDDSVVGIPCTPKQHTATNSTNNTDVFFMLLTLITRSRRRRWKKAIGNNNFYDFDFGILWILLHDFFSELSPF